MKSYTITEEPVQPLMFKRLYQEAHKVNEPGPDVIVYIENKKRIFVRDVPNLIQGIADLLTIQGIPFRKYRNDEIENIKNLFEDLETPVYTGWYDWTCLSCSLHGKTTEKNFECHPGQTVITRADPCFGCPALNTQEKYRFFACESQDGTCPPGFPKGRGPE